MNKIIYSMLFVMFISGIGITQQMENRRISIGGKAPMFNWLQTNDSEITSSGINLGYSIGAQLEMPFNDNVYLFAGLYFTGNLGGEVRHITGGNFWRNARLSNPDWNNGIKPLPDGVQLRYRVNMLEIPVGLKLCTNYYGNTRYFMELPVFSLGIITKSRGAIDATGIRTTDEQINEETKGILFSLGGSAGIIYDLGSVEVFGGLYYQHFFTDLVRNNGQKAIETTPGMFTQVDELSKHTMNGIGLRLGLNF